MAQQQRQARRRQAPPNSSPGGTRVPRLFGLAMLSEAATLGIASYLHRDAQIPLGFTVIHGEHFTAAATPEAIIGAVLGAGAVFVLAAPGRGRRVALGTIGFAVLGVIVGLAEVLRGVGPAGTADLVYHSALLAALVATLVTLARRSARPRSTKVAHRV